MNWFVIEADMKFVIYKDAGGYWRWTLYGDNNRIVADSGEGYHRRSDAESGIALVKQTVGDTPTLERKSVA